MAERREPNAQNSELDPSVHPSGARIEKMEEKAHRNSSKRNYQPPRDQTEGARDGSEAPHRTTPQNRTRE